MIPEKLRDSALSSDHNTDQRRPPLSHCLPPRLNPGVSALSTLLLYLIRTSKPNSVFDQNYKIYLIRTTSPMAGLPQGLGCAWSTHMQRSKLRQHIRSAGPDPVSVCAFWLEQAGCLSAPAVIVRLETKHMFFSEDFFTLCLSYCANFNPSFS